MLLILDEDDALELAFRRDIWMWIKAPVWLFLVIYFYAPLLWKTGTVLVGSIVCGFTVNCFAGRDVGVVSLSIALFVHVMIISGVSWYALYTLAWLSAPGWMPKAAATVAALAFLPGVLLTGVVFLMLSDRLGLPLDAVLAFTDRYVPFDAWRAIPISEAP